MINTFQIAKILWGILTLFWILSAFTAKRAVKEDEPGHRLFYLIFWIVGSMLLFSRAFPYPFLNERLYVHQPLLRVTGLLFTAGGLSFAVWARIVLGKNWSGRVTIKENHELINTGPYAYSRHPIYTGLLFAFLGTALILGEPRGYIALPVLFVGIMLKIVREEKFISEAFGERYSVYAKRVRRLIPFVY